MKTMLPSRREELNIHATGGLIDAGSTGIIMHEPNYSLSVPLLSRTEPNDFVGLSKKAVNKILQTLQQFNCASPILTSELEQIKFPSGVALKVNNALPKIFHELFSKGNGITELSCDNIFSVVDALAKIISRGNLQELIITVGMGASEEMPSLRLPSYILPAIKVLKGISDCELNIGLPTVRVFKATHAGVYANSMDLAKAKFVTEITLGFISGFINKFYPDLSSHFVFEGDSHYKDTQTYSTIVDTADKIKKLTGIDNELAVLKIMGEKHGGKNGRGNAIFYAAAHPFYNQAVVSKTGNNSVTKFVAENPNPKLILDFGGRPQKTFNSVITALRASLSETEFTFPPLVNVITKTGKIPVYYRAKGGDILLSDTCSSFDDFAVDQMTECDFDFLFQEINDYEYIQYVNQFKQQSKILTT
jgi:hypothetical protein